MSTTSAVSPPPLAPDSRRWVLARRTAVVNLICQMVIVLTGGLVRLTGSGLGCPTWPRCTPDSLLPTPEQSEGFHKVIEFGNRTLTGVLTIAALAVLVAVLRIPQRPRRLALLAATPLVLTLAQAVLGGITVLLKLSPLIVAAHLLLSMIAIALSTLLWLRVRSAGHDRGEGRETALPQARPSTRHLAWVLAIDAGLVLILGTLVTASGPHSGDADESARLGLDIAAIARVHAASVWIFVGLLAALWWRLRAVPGSQARRWVTVLAGVVLVQGIVGYVQYALAVPWQLVAVHMGLAALFAAATTAAVDAAIAIRPGVGQGHGH